MPSTASSWWRKPARSRPISGLLRGRDTGMVSPEQEGGNMRRRELMFGLVAGGLLARLTGAAEQGKDAITGALADWRNLPETKGFEPAFEYLAALDLAPGRWVGPRCRRRCLRLRLPVHHQDPRSLPFRGTPQVHRHPVRSRGQETIGFLRPRRTDGDRASRRGQERRVLRRPGPGILLGSDEYRPVRDPLSGPRAHAEPPPRWSPRRRQSRREGERRLVRGTREVGTSQRLDPRLGFTIDSALS